MQAPEPPRPSESRLKVLKEGEMSPFKIVVTILMRENFLSGDPKKIFSSLQIPPKQNIQSLLLIYKFITMEDIPFSKLVEIISSGDNPIRPEIVRKFQKVIQNLDEHNCTFLYDLVNSIIEVDGSQIVLLKKRIIKNSPIGKFLRLVLMNIKRLTYPQVHYLYKELIKYIKEPELAQNNKNNQENVPQNPAPEESDSAASEAPRIVIISNKKLEKLENSPATVPLQKTRSSPRIHSSSTNTTPTSTTTPKSKTPKKIKVNENEITVVQEGEEGYLISEDEAENTKLALNLNLNSKAKRKLKLSSFPATPVPDTDNRRYPAYRPRNIFANHGNWDLIKTWSRKQIERALKQLSENLNRVNCPSYPPGMISSFLEALKFNPSASVLLPQINFMEYINSLRIKDVVRCTESLHASFDLRIKPNTSELHKGTPYGPYNFAVFFHHMGYEKDARMYLEEAFRAGHAAGDSTCLHYCHNLWSSFHQEPYIDAIVTETKEVEKSMAYLHSLNVLSNAFDFHAKGMPPEEIIYSLWHYNGESDMEEVESLLLLSMASFFAIFGWNQLIALPCQIILQSTLNWPLKTFCAALCLLSRTVLTNGDTKISTELMEYGNRRFEMDTTVAGELFTLEFSLFQALKAFFAYRPINHHLIATIAACDTNEALYWGAYNKMILNDWEESAKILKRLYNTISNERGLTLLDLRMRCMLLQAEIECLCQNVPGALNYLLDGLELSKEIHSDFYITLCLVQIASLQCHLGFTRNALKTFNSELKSMIRCCTPLLDTRMDIVNIKIKLKLDSASSPSPHKITMKTLDNFKKILESAENVYLNWENSYRIKEIQHLKILLIEKCLDITGSGSTGERDSTKCVARGKKELEKIKTFLFWSPQTCLM